MQDIRRNVTSKKYVYIIIETVYGPIKSKRFLVRLRVSITQKNNGVNNKFSVQGKIMNRMLLFIGFLLCCIVLYNFIDIQKKH